MPPSQMTSLRIPEDHYAALGQRVGFDGMRNRSDVVRAAITLYLETAPSHADVRTVKFNIGTDTRNKLAHLYELEGISPAEVARLGLELYFRQTLADSDTLTMLLEARVEEMRVKTRPHEDHTA
jgi:Arc/MetJ-type ribon-helix-helix transcriptional regulator